MPSRHQWPAKYLVPAIAAVAVAAIILAAHAVTGPRPGDPAISRSTPAATASPSPGPGPDLLLATGFVPPHSGIISLHYTPPGNTAQYSPPGADRGTVTAEFFTGYRPGAFAADVMRQGIAARQVVSVTAVLPDGRSYQGAVGSARAWPRTPGR
jgi:hypothetical protein